MTFQAIAPVPMMNVRTSMRWMLEETSIGANAATATMASDM